MVVLDTDDPPRLASFYNALLGWQTESEEEDWITITGGPGARLAFQLAVDHRPPTWPDNDIPQQSHLDLQVDNLEEAAAYAESIGPAERNGTSLSSSTRAAIPSVCATEASGGGSDRSAAEYSDLMTKWEYVTVPLLVHATKQILDNWGQDGWELVQVVPGLNPENLVAYLKRPLPGGDA